MENIQYYIEFTNKAFQYFNNKINKFNTDIKLEINVCYNNIFGNFIFPNTIMIYVYDIMKSYNNNNEYIKLCIVDTIIHELYHCDQLLDYIRYNNDIIYKNKIEQDVRYMTLLYIFNNNDAICSNLNMIIPESYFSKFELINYSNYYERGTFFYFYFNSINKLIMGSIKDLFDIINTKQNIYLSIDKYILAIKYNNEFEKDITKFNTLIYNQIYMYNIYKIKIFKNIIDDNTIIIMLNIYDKSILPIIKS